MIKPINFTDVNPINKTYDIKIKKEINLVISKKDFILGKSLKIFENNFARIAKSRFAIGCASGTDALRLALLSLDLIIFLISFNESLSN